MVGSRSGKGSSDSAVVATDLCHELDPSPDPMTILSDTDRRRPC